MLAAASAHDSPIWTILFQLLVLLGTALVAGMIFERFRQSAILGYLLAGMIMGPSVLGIVTEDSGVPVMAELGVSLLLFAIGLEFSAKRLLRLGPIAIGGGSLQVLITLGLGALIALIFGLSGRTSLALGATLALSSTACVLRLLIDRAEIDSMHGRTSLGVLLLQDVAVVPLVLLVTMLGGSGGIAEMGIGLAKALGLILLLIGVFLLLSVFILPRILKHLSMSRDRELLVLLAVVLAIGSAWAAHSLNLSPALGAFIAGMMLAESPFATQIRSDIGALRILFITLFFASVGMLGDPVWISQNFIAVGLLTVLIIAGKATIISVVARIFKLPLSHAVAAGISLAQVGEFGVVIAGIAKGNELFNDEIFRLIVSATLMTLFITPFLVKGAMPIGRFIAKLVSPLSANQHDEKIEDEGGSTDRILLIGFGPSGQRVGEELIKRDDVDTLVVDMRPNNIDLAKSLGFKAELGDATNMELLVHYGIETARAIVITVPDHRAIVRIATAVRTLNPTIAIIARGRYHAFVPELEAAGATVVVNEERNTGRRLASAMRTLLSR